MPATGVRAPERMLVAVRAMAPVAGRPPNSGDAMLAMPCAISSTFGLCRSPLMRSATTADISDSIAPSRATVSAGDEQRRDQARAWNFGTTSGGQPLRDAAEPGADRLDRQLEAPRRRACPPAAPRWSRARGGTNRFHTIIATSAPTASAVVGRRDACRACSASATIRGQNSPGTVASCSAEEVLDLRAGDEDARCRW